MLGLGAGASVLGPGASLSPSQSEDDSANDES